MTRHLFVYSCLGFLCLSSVATAELPPTFQGYSDCRQKCAQTYPGETEDGAFCRISCNNQFPDAATAAYGPRPFFPPPPPPQNQGFLSQFGGLGSGVNGQLNFNLNDSSILLILMVLQAFMPSSQPSYQQPGYYGQPGFFGPPQPPFFPSPTSWSGFGPDPVPVPLPAPYGWGDGPLQGGANPGPNWPPSDWPM